jgi:hypothetical protein
MWTRTVFSLLSLSLAAAPVSFGGQAEDGSILHLRQSPLLHAQDFFNNPDLVAEPPQSVLLDGNLPAGPAEPAIRYRLEKGRHYFCLTGSDTYYTGMILRDEADKVIFTMPRTERCRSADLAQGVYTAQISHSNALPDPQQLTFVGVDEPSPPLHDANGNPLGGYWAITPLGGSQTDSGTLRPQPPPRNLGGIYGNDMPLVADFSSSNWDETSLFSFPPPWAPGSAGASGFLSGHDVLR